jgi:hypothetical protein
LLNIKADIEFVDKGDCYHADIKEFSEYILKYNAKANTNVYDILKKYYT